MFNSVLNNRNVLVNNGKLSAHITKWHHYTLKSGDFLQSRNHKFALKMDTNCNLFVHKKHGGVKQLFATNTRGKGSNCQAMVEKNGNFVVKSGSGEKVWATNTIALGKGPYKLILKNNGNLVLYHRNLCKWASTSCPLPRKFRGLKGKKAERKIKKQLKKQLKKLKKPQFKPKTIDRTKPKPKNRRPKISNKRPKIVQKTPKRIKAAKRKAKNLFGEGLSAWSRIKRAAKAALKGAKGKGNQLNKLKKQLKKGLSFSQLKEIAMRKLNKLKSKSKSKAKSKNRVGKKPTNKKALKKNLKSSPWMVEIRNIFNKREQSTEHGWNRIVAILRKYNFKGNQQWLNGIRKTIGNGYDKFLNAVTTTPTPKKISVKPKGPVKKPTPIRRARGVRRNRVRRHSPKPVYRPYVYRRQWRWVIRQRSYLTYYWRGYWSYYSWLHCRGWWWWRRCWWVGGHRWVSYPQWYWASYGYWSHEFW